MKKMKVGLREIPAWAMPTAAPLLGSWIAAADSKFQGWCNARAASSIIRICAYAGVFEDHGRPSTAATSRQCGVWKVRRQSRLTASFAELGHHSANNPGFSRIQ